MAADCRNLRGAAYISARAKALREAAAPPKPPEPAKVAATDMTDEQVAAKYPKRVAEMSQSEYYAARKGILSRGGRR